MAFIAGRYTTPLSSTVVTVFWTIQITLLRVTRHDLTEISLTWDNSVELNRNFCNIILFRTFPSPSSIFLQDSTVSFANKNCKWSWTGTNWARLSYIKTLSNLGVVDVALVVQRYTMMPMMTNNQAKYVM